MPNKIAVRKPNVTPEMASDEYIAEVNAALATVEDWIEEPDSDEIVDAFAWDETEQGHDFWDKADGLLHLIDADHVCRCICGKEI